MKYVQLGESPPALRLVTANPQVRTRHFAWHQHPFYELGLVLSGDCDWRLGPRRRVSLHAGEAILIRPRTLHCEEVSRENDASLAWVGFDFAGRPPAWCHRVLFLEDDFAEIGSHFQALLREHHLTDPRTRLRISLALQSLILLVTRRAENPARPRRAARVSDLNRRQRQMVESAAHYFRNNLRHPLSIAQVAAYHSLCPAHFSWLFRRRHRLTPRSFLRETRLARAAELLTGSDATLKEIAHQCGFVDAAHLCKSFKLRHRLTPTVYRKRNVLPARSLRSFGPVK